MSKDTNRADGADSATEEGKSGDSTKVKDQRKKFAEFGLNTVLTLVTVGLLWYLRASPLVCSVEGGGCTLIGVFGEGLRLLIPVLIVRLLVDLPLGLLRLPTFGLVQRPLWQAWYELGLSAFDAFFPAWMLILGPGRFVNVAYLEVLGVSDGIRAGLPLVLYAVLAAVLGWTLWQVIRRIRAVLWHKPVRTK